MDQISRGKDCVALHMPGVPGKREAAALVRQTLRERGEIPWPRMELELYPGEESSLVIARPAVDHRVYISLRALCLLADYAAREHPAETPERETEL